MSSNVSKWFVEKWTEIILPMIGGLLASRIEAMVIMEQADYQDQLEERARQFDAENKPELAAALRTQAARIHPDTAATTAVSVIRSIQQAETSLARGLPSAAPDALAPPQEPQPTESNHRPVRGSGRKLPARPVSPGPAVVGHLAPPRIQDHD